MALRTTTLGFPRTGARREMKVALEKYWGGELSEAELRAASEAVAAQSVQEQAAAGVSLIGVGEHTLYDHVLDWSERFGLTCRRVKEAGLSGLDAYFTQARGRDGVPALDMTKYFDSNYHYMVAEVPADVEPKAEVADFVRLVELAQAQAGKARVVPIVLGPVTLAMLSKPEAGLTREALAEKLVGAYEAVLRTLQGLGVAEVQVHEPYLVTSAAKGLQGVTEAVYGRLCAVGVPLNLCAHFDSLDAAVYKYVVGLPVARVTLDFCRGAGMLDVVRAHGFPADKALGAGVVDGRSVWRSEAEAATLLGAVAHAARKAKEVVAATSCSLQFVPYSVAAEEQLPAGLKERLAFAVEKLQVLQAVAQAQAGAEAGASSSSWAGEDNSTDVALATVGAAEAMLARAEAFEARRPQQVQVPLFPTTTIGSFPQTAELRRARLAYKKGQLPEAEYHAVIDAEMAKNVAAQDEVGLDVYVHGEPERSDMVEHFGERLEGMAFTRLGWVQSYGSRYVRPPIIHGTVKRRGPITVREFAACQALTAKPVKGMLTGPVTILNWSFCRTDVPRSQQAYEIALAVREEVADLEAAGCRVIQVDEAALRERLPLKAEAAAAYMRWSVRAFRLSTAVAGSATQLVTHMCYSTFEDIVADIAAMDADVLTIENSRSDNAMVEVLARSGYPRDVGPGVYDIHSPVVPTEAQLVAQLRSLAKSGLPLSRLWVNPDCGLKTRKWAEVTPSLKNMVAAARVLRAEAAGTPHSA